jgi:NAD(P)-dependent dehydrogenase (short-subunit alcohol dehydrogenase family)
VAKLIRDAGRKAVLIPGDIKDEAFCQKLVAEAARQLGGLDILVNNAARQFSRDSILDITTAEFDETYKTNVYAMFWITKAAVPHLKPGPRSSTPPRSTPMSPARTCWTTPRPRERS